MSGAGFAAGIVLVVTTVSLPEAPWWVVTVIGVAAGMVFGAMMGPATARSEREMWRAAGSDLTWQQFRGAARASRTGRVPDDPQLCAAAIRLGVYQLAQHRRRRKGTLIALSLAAGFSVLKAVSGGWLGLLGVVFFAVVGVVFLRERTRVGRALVRLRAASCE
ncbi:hypothetical protein [Amycolatopsis sp. cmx-8-4]|uniref:hypothetical protein n=1 Tax=Amycolatopsis sp. cmx-8-4 TaxID=2790947 RepID=UPI00397CDC35